MATNLQQRLMEADRQARREGVVWETLRRLAMELQRLGAPYAVAGGIALQHHGLQRSTQDLNIVVRSADDLRLIHDRLIGHGYVRQSSDSRHLRDETTRIRIEFLLTGEFSGDGQPKPVAFPSPAAVAERSPDGLYFVSLRVLIEMKLASAKTAPHRIKHRADVLELIHLLSLPASFADQLNLYVQEDFRDLAALPPPSERD